MVERVRIEVRAELPVDDREHVLVEGRRNPGAVVIRRDQRGGVLDQVGAEEQRVVGTQLRPEAGQELGAFVGQQVAQRSAEEREQARAVPLRQLQTVQEVGDQHVHAKLGVVGEQRVSRLRQGALADIYRQVALQRAGGAEGVDQQAGFLGGARAEFDQGSGSGRRGDLVRPRGQDLPLGARRVVLGQLGDLFEEFAAARVIQPLGRQPFRCAGEAPQHIGAERG